MVQRQIFLWGQCKAFGRASDNYTMQLEVNVPFAIARQPALGMGQGSIHRKGLPHVEAPPRPRRHDRCTSRARVRAYRGLPSATTSPAVRQRVATESKSARLPPSSARSTMAASHVAA